ncbi:MAG: NAD(P)/FAD-dependent oxidoreductase [Aquificae bacterium]|nr:NAD(P)/FAD-dependent oxidoreductase [Aquificota bacterium]
MKVVIVGNGPAAVSAVEAFRSVDPDSTLVVLSAEPHPAYAPNCLENVIRGDVTDEQLFYKGGTSFYERHRVEFRPSSPVKKVDALNKRVYLESGEEISYDKCLLAPGAYAFVPPIEGRELEGVTPAKTLDEALYVRNEVLSGRVKEAVVVGAGPIGVEDAEALTELGVKVTVVELEDRPLPRMLDRQLARLYEKKLKEAGIRLLTAHQVVAFHGSKRVEAVEVKPRGSDGSFFIKAQLVLLAVGVRPRTHLVEGVELHVDEKTGRPLGGVVVDRYQRTSVPDLYAAGDVCSGPDAWGRLRWIALFPAAQQGGAVAGYNMAGLKVRSNGLPDYNAVKTRFAVAGGAGSFSDAEEELLFELNGRLIKVFLKDGKVVGYQFLGPGGELKPNARNPLVKALGFKKEGLGAEETGVLFHFFLKLNRRFKHVHRKAVEEGLLRALAYEKLEEPLYEFELG